MDFDLCMFLITYGKPRRDITNDQIGRDQKYRKKNIKFFKSQKVIHFNKN